MKKANTRGLLKKNYMKLKNMKYIGISLAEDVRKRESQHKQQDEHNDVQKGYEEHVEAHRIQIITNQCTESHFEKKHD